jgi:hypothetical protein
MLLDKLQTRYGIDEVEIGAVVTFMMNDIGLFNATKIFNLKRSSTGKKVLLPAEMYTIATSLSKEMYAGSLREVAPAFFKEKEKLNDVKSAVWNEKKEHNQTVSKLKNIADDLVMFLAEKETR